MNKSLLPVAPTPAATDLTEGFPITGLKLQSSSTPSAAPTCQICFDTTLVSETVRDLCGQRCIAVVCRSCLESHICVTLSHTLPGILPRVRCPVCLQRLRKSAWRRHVTKGVIDRYERLCAKPCALLPPCCHDANYTQLPVALRRPQPPFELVLEAQVHAQIPSLRRALQRFVRYQLSPRQLVRLIDEMVRPIGCTELSLQAFVDLVAARVLDDERRAALVLAFHAVHKRVITRCCLVHLCFNCKRKWDDAHEHDPLGSCDQVELTDQDLVQCRSCRSLLVKVEGCDSVECPCGFAMQWTSELLVREQRFRGLIPAAVDIYDVDGFEVWDEWRRQLLSILQHDTAAVRAAWRLKHVNRLVRIYRPRLRRVVQTYIWQKRFHAALPAMVEQIYSVRRQFVVQKLGRCIRFKDAIRSYVSRICRWRICMKSLLLQVPMYDEDVWDPREAELGLGLF